MILTELQDYLRDHRRASVQQLSQRFRIQPAALHGMLDRLARKGRVRRLDRPSRCSGCHVCPDSALELYEWVDGVVVPCSVAPAGKACPEPSAPTSSGTR